ncbi:protocadherin gamma subfamily A, 2 precursor [Gallus gallus]|uniref:protocadherin gamma subfamily A, 2 precursor n=1 Tax=Gallus gallus TaxID=9031 RepID=UPI001CF74867|nr:protocadherin gamma subfamily A, 2 precursor [Gallus gallus]
MCAAREGRCGRRQRALLCCVLVAAWEAARGQLRYSVPEELPKGSFVGDVAKDLALELAALGAGGARVVSQGRTQYFALHASSGHLVTTERIDREQLCRLLEKCVLRCELIVEGEMKVYAIEVEITDINDNTPSFGEGQIELRTNEMAVIGMRYALRRAHDPDMGTNSLQSYTLSGDEHFSLSVQAGADGEKRPELVLAKALDREEAAFHELLLRASDGGDPARTGTARIRVAVLDANDNAPAFSQAVYTVRVPEDVPVGSTLLRVTATDPDDGTNADVKYLFQEVLEQISNTFHIEPKTGAISLVRNLDFEEADFYEFLVQAHDGGGLSDDAKITVSVTDVNDNAPEISVRSALSEISEDAAPGTVVALLHVQDRDSGANGEVRCSLGEGVPFRLERALDDYYSVVTARELDRERASEYNVTVRAADGGSPALRSGAVLALRVLDVNDNAPVFAEARYSARLPENNAEGALVLTVRAWDADWGQNARVRYRLREGRLRGAPLSSYVSVQAETGALYALRSFDYEEVREVELWVRAEDGGAPPLSSNVSVRLLIADENDNAPQVLYPPAAPGPGPGSGAGVGAWGSASGAWSWAGVELAPRSAEPGALVASAGAALRGVPASHFVGIDGVRAFLRSYSHDVSLTADSRKSQLRCAGGSCCDTLPARPPPDEAAPLRGEDAAAHRAAEPDGLPQAQPNPDWRFSQTQRPGTSGSQNGEEGGAWPNNQFDTEMLQAMILASANEAADVNATLGGGTGTMGLSARYGPQFTLQHVPDYRQNVYIPGSTATLSNAAGKRDAKPSGGNKKKSGKKEKK